MSKGKIIRELKKHRETMPRQTLKTIRGQAVAGDIKGARKGLDRLKEKDCFAYKNKRCTALKVKDCEGCDFYKTKDKVEEERADSIGRIMSLDKNTRAAIIQKYKLGL